MQTQHFVIGAMVVAMLGALVALGWGLATMVRGQNSLAEAHKSQKLMWWRIYAQGAALALFALLVWLVKK